ncbi:MAG: YcjF family protein [Actinomycetales bacterium]
MTDQADSHVPDLARPQVEGMFEQRLAEAFASLGTFNLAVFGKTGVGKSPLVNAIFGRDVARTGMGKPVTSGLVYYRHPDGFLGVYDSEGFETGTAGDVILDGLHRVVAQHGALAIDERIHAVWYLVRWSDRRFEQAQADFVSALQALGLPVILVMTQVPTRQGQVHPEALEFAGYIEGLGLPISPRGKVVLTNARPDPFTDSPVYGLQALLDDTYAVVPAAAEQALTAAQVLDVGRKKKAVAAIVNQAAVIAAGIGVTPIPFADAALLVPNQVTMIARITAAYGLPPSRSRALAVAGSIILTGGATMAGRYAVTSLLKFVPGGNVAGSAISATVAASLTKAVGMAWSRVCETSSSLASAAARAASPAVVARSVIVRLVAPASSSTWDTAAWAA